MVEEASGGVACFEIGSMAVAGQVEGLRQGGAGAFVVGRGVGELGGDPVELARDVVLFGLEQVEGNCPGVVGVEQLLTSCFKVDALLVELLALRFGGGVEVVEVFEDEGLDVIA
ncbi:hypothetical protein [Tsukamurella soli]|uniref:hypothetical protein n=1 Tax=Tsukamurella soli TaxID=644556 RepID=UPI0031ED5919